MIYKAKSSAELVDLIDKYEVVSFDIFDTLIMRNTLVPEDVFRVMEVKLKGGLEIEEFTRNRERAVLENPTANPNIHQIYDKLAELTGISEQTKKEILELELEVERKVLVKREEMADVLKEVCKRGKKVCLITDMYLPGDIITDLLENLGICGFDDLMVSCDYRTLKGEELFDRFQKRHPAESYLHIGDNIFSDIECSQKHGMDCVMIDSALSLFRKSPYCVMEDKASDLTKRNMLGMFVTAMFCNPLSSQGKKTFYLKDIADIFINPVVFSMICDLKSKVSEKEYDKVLFASRDGFLLQQLYDIARNSDMPESIYFYTSRRAVSNIELPDDHKILWLANLPYAYSKDDILSEVFHIEGRKYEETEDFNDYILQYRDKIMEKSEELYQNYKTYLDVRQVGGGSYLFVDLVSSGTCQMYLTNMLEGLLEGYYLCKLKTDEAGKEQLKCQTLFEPVDLNSKEYGFHKMYYLFESILTSYEPSVVRFEEGGIPVFAGETRTQKELDQLKTIHQEMLDYFKLLYYMCDGKSNHLEIFADGLIQIFLQQDENADCCLDTVLTDDWMNTRVSVDKISR